MIDKRIQKQMIQMCVHQQSLRAIKGWSLDARTPSFSYGNPEIDCGGTR